VNESLRPQRRHLRCELCQGQRPDVKVCDRLDPRSLRPSPVRACGRCRAHLALKTREYARSVPTQIGNWHE
jgi:hypothetical protein